MALEYEMLAMVSDFKSTGIILSLNPPILLRKGLMLLKRQNVQVIYQKEVPKPVVETKANVTQSSSFANN